MILRCWLAGAGVALASWVCAAPSLMEHTPTTGVFGEPSGTTMREPDIPREDDAVQIWAKIGPSFTYNRVAIYYTTDGTAPSGSFGTPSGTTQVLLSNAGGVSFVRNQPRAGGGNDDWWRGVLPTSARQFGQQIRYRIGAWQTGETTEIFAGGPSQIFTFSNRIAWPGAGAGQSNPAAGYPPVHFWKEEGVTGNNFINVMVDQNGTVYDIYYPGAGGVKGVSTRNEGYSGGLDTFPPGLPFDHRGQMHVNQVMAGLRVDGVTHWMSNPGGVSYSQITQSYIPNSNAIQGSSRLVTSGANITVQQFDFAPAGQSAWPTDSGGTERKSIYVKRFILTNNNPTPETINFYVYADWALNGGDVYDTSFVDSTRNVMVAVDNVSRTATANGNNIQPPNEYNPTTFSGFQKNVSLFLATGLKNVGTPGTGGGTWATDTWRDTSADQGQGWIATRVTLQPGVPHELNMIVAGGFDNFPNASGTYNFQLAPVMEWFRSGNMAQSLQQTNTYWNNWLNEGVMVDLPEARYKDLWVRSKLGSALHVDGLYGGVIAGMHNGAYPYVWPRDAMYAAVSFARAGHIPEALNAIKWMRESAFRGNESWGKGFFYQKYTTDGNIIWGAPQVDETAVLPWAVLYLYHVLNDFSVLQQNWTTVRDSAFAMSSDSNLDSRLYYDDTFNLMYSMNIWEDSFDLFNYSNANVIRGLEDAARIANRLGNTSDATLFQNRANAIRNGLDARLAWNGENTDISQLGIVYPFEIYSPTHPRAVKVINRINGVEADAFGAFEPLINFGGEFNGLINRYWGDSYWNGGPWWLSTLWYGLYYAARGNETPGQTDIDIHKSKIDLLFPWLGPMGLGAEQIAPANSEVYPGFRLQTAFPNAWESMSTYMDSVMMFLGLTPDNTTLRLAPQNPSDWSWMTFRNVRSAGKMFHIAYRQFPRANQVNVTNVSGGATPLDVTIKIPSNARPSRVTVGGQTVPFTFNGTAMSVRVQRPLAPAAGSITPVRVEYTVSLTTAAPLTPVP